MSIVGEAVLKASIDFLLKKLASSELLSFGGQEQIYADLKKWENKLGNIYAVLEDAEEKQITNRFVMKWLVDLQNLAYDVEDILDEFETEVLKRKLSYEPQASTSKARMLIPTCCTNFNPRSLKFNVKMGSEIKKITDRLEEMVARKNELQLLDIPKERSNDVKRSDQRLPTTSLSETHVYGREEDQEALVKLLLEDDANEDGISVIPIVGIGGVGKTTLAQNVYNDARVKSHFDLRAWTCVSDDFDVIRTTKAILQSISSDAGGDHSDLNKLQVKLEEMLLKKKFFVVLDDIWTDNYNLWTSLLRPFRAGSSGSKIIVTTRSDNVSSKFGTVPTHRLKELPFDHCLSIFTHHSLGRKNFEEHQNLKEVGEKIVSKCDGLPLAAKTLGGLLRNNNKCDDWERVLYSNIWDLPQETDDIIPALKLSYYYLPSHLKRCFAYCSLLPKDYEFKKEEMILLWMAQGFLQQSSKIQLEELEDVGDKWFCELQSRSFFQQSNNHSSLYVMHDLINDLAQLVAGKFFFFRMGNKMEGDKQRDVSKFRHLSYVQDQCDGIKKFEGLNEFKHLRTFLSLTNGKGWSWITSEIFNILPKLLRLRVLSLNEYNIYELSNAIGDLKHLRHVDLSRTAICCLPESINSLYNLLTLKLEGCCNLLKLCDVGNLINLRYLNTYGTKLQEMPSSMGKLTSLRILSDFVVSYNTGPGLKVFKLLKHLQGTLRMRGLANVHDVGDAKEADLSGKSNLRELHLAWYPSHFAVNVEMEMLVLNLLRPNPKLEQLNISGYHGMSLSPWLEDTSFSNLVFLKIEHCSNCTSLPSVGQLPSLKTLLISCMDGIKRVGPEFYGNGCSTPFSSLETLTLCYMGEWEEWISYGNGQGVEEFPHLQELSLINCPKLQGKLPEHFPSLKRLVIERCHELQMSMASLPVDCRCEIIGCKQAHPRTDIDFGSLNPMIFSYIQKGQVSLIKRFMQSLSKDKVEVVVYELPTSFWHSGIMSMQDARCFITSSFQPNHQMLLDLLEEREDKLQLRGLPDMCQYLGLDSVCLMNLTQLLLNFRFLIRIHIINCSDLVSFSEARLPSQLRAIVIKSCDALECLPDSWMESTSLECLSVRKCESLMHLATSQLPPNLKKLVICACDGLMTLIQEENKSSESSIIGITECSSTKSSFSKNELPATLEHIEIMYCNKLEALPHNMHKLNHLQHLRISKCSSLVSFPAGGLPSTNLTYLKISNCDKLEELPNNMRQLEHLQEVKIQKCSSLVSFSAGSLPSANLKKLHIKGCDKLKALPNGMHQLYHLQEIKISECSSLVSFPEEGLPSTNLTELTICECEKLEALPNGMHQLHHLQKIRISHCSSLVSFPEEGLPSTNLTELIICECEKLEALPNGMRQLHHLRKIKIYNCSSLVSFPEEGLPSTNLTKLTICDCEKLEALPNGMHNLCCLRQVKIRDCQAMESLPEDGFPINLESLSIFDTPKICQLLFAWGLHRLNSLRKLYISGCPDVMSFPPEETRIMLPTSLTILQIKKFPNLEYISSVIRSLNSLERLHLECCPKLKSFPKKGLPLSLLILMIKDCPLLEQNYKENGGKYRPLISYIPSIEFLDKFTDFEESDSDFYELDLDFYEWDSD